MSKKIKLWHSTRVENVKKEKRKGNFGSARREDSVRESEKVARSLSLNRCRVKEFSETDVERWTRMKAKSECIAIHTCFYSRQGKMQEYYPLLKKKKADSVRQPRSQESLLLALT